jgi:thiol-disulfide isomerase/thioredoxin
VKGIMSMKKILAFYIDGCPYCRQARKAVDELKKETQYANLQIEWVNENQHPEISERYDYYYVPTMFVDDVKIYEAKRGETYEECRENVKRVFDSSIS